MLIECTRYVPTTYVRRQKAHTHIKVFAPIFAQVWCQDPRRASCFFLKQKI